jgi:hypothetical protein
VCVRERGCVTVWVVLFFMGSVVCVRVCVCVCKIVCKCVCVSMCVCVYPYIPIDQFAWFLTLIAYVGEVELQSPVSKGAVVCGLKVGPVEVEAAVWVCVCEGEGRVKGG